jgi:hypothetical protein
MLEQRILLPKEDEVRRKTRAQKIATYLSGLDPKKPWEVLVRPHKRSRSNQQNRYERGVACVLLSQAVGYEPEEIHEYLCGTYFGWRQVACPKTPNNPCGIRDVPIRTTTTNADGERDVLGKADFSDFVAFIQRFGAQRGVYIPDPDPDFALRQDEKAA